MAPPDSNTDGWNEWRNHVLKELERLQDWMGKVSKEQRRLSDEVATLKVKATLWGLTGGLIPVVVMIAVQALKN